MEATSSFLWELIREEHCNLSNLCQWTSQGDSSSSLTFWLSKFRHFAEGCLCQGPLQDSFDCSVLLRIDNVLAHHHFGSSWLRMHRHVGHVVYLPPSVYGQQPIRSGWRFGWWPIDNCSFSNAWFNYSWCSHKFMVCIRIHVTWLFADGRHRTCYNADLFLWTLVDARGRANAGRSLGGLRL